jgi:hypothetical protein
MGDEYGIQRQSPNWETLKVDKDFDLSWCFEETLFFLSLYGLLNRFTKLAQLIIR